MKRTTSPARATKETMLTIGILGLRATPYIVAYNVFLCIPVGLLLGPVAFGIASFVCTVATGIWLGRKFQRGAWPRSRSLPRHLTGVCVALAVTGSVATAGSASVAPTEAVEERGSLHIECAGAQYVCSLWEETMAWTTCFGGCVGAELTCIGALLTVRVAKTPQAIVAAAIIAAGSCAAVFPACLSCVEKALRCDLVDLRTRAERAIDRVQEELDRLECLIRSYGLQERC